MCGLVLQAVYHSFGSRELKEVMKQQHGQPHEQAAAERSGDAPPSSDIMASNRNLVENYLRWALPACPAHRQPSGCRGLCSGGLHAHLLICTSGPGALLGQHSWAGACRQMQAACAASSV